MSDGLVVFYGAYARLAREVGVPVFIDGDTGETVYTRRPWARCPCGHLWLFHDVYEHTGDGSETCCVSGCDQTRCPGSRLRQDLE